MSQNEKALKQFIELCLEAKESKLSTELFNLFFTPEERNDLALRYLIIKTLLAKEKTQRQIAKDLNVSISKITRGSNELKRMSKNLLAYLTEKL